MVAAVAAGRVKRVMIEKLLAKRQWIFSDTMIQLIRTTWTTWAKRCVTEAAKKRRATWRRKQSSRSSWRTSRRIALRFAKIWWRWPSLPSSSNGSSPSLVSYTLDASSATAKTNSSASFTTSSLRRQMLFVMSNYKVYPWIWNQIILVNESGGQSSWATTKLTFRKCSQTIRSARSLNTFMVINHLAVLLYF